MKQFAVITGILSVSFLVVWVFFLPGLKSSPESTFKPGNEFAVPVSGVESRRVAPAPVYAADGSIRDLSANGYGDKVFHAESSKVAPVFDTTGAVVSDPTGTLWSASHP